MVRLFQSVGCDAKTQLVDRKSGNVICDFPGETSETIIVSGHFDFIGAGRGIVDDWSGASMLASLYETLRPIALKHSLKFVAFAGEERGLFGSRRYVENLKKNAEPLPDAFVNLECLGMAPPKVWASRADPVLLRNLFQLSDAMHIDLQAVNIENVGEDDSFHFSKERIPVITIHSVTQQNLHVLHSSQDRLDAINVTDYYDAYRLTAFYLKHLDTQLASKPRPHPHR